jgi:hypothetical protein
MQVFVSVGLLEPRPLYSKAPTSLTWQGHELALDLINQEVTP